MLTLALALALLPPSGGSPYRSPQLAASRSIVAVAFGSGTEIFVATSKDQGNTFSKPVKVAAAHVLPLTRHRGPRIVISKGAIIVTAVGGHTVATGVHAHGLPSDGDLMSWRSTDQGRTWSKPVRVNDVAGAPTEGLHTLAAAPDGTLFAAWLDHRLKGTTLFGSYSRDGGNTWSKNELIYQSPEETICQCCHPSASFSGRGELNVMWRNCLGGSRDMFLIRSGGRPEKLGLGTWAINACPMDGGGITEHGGKVYTIWRRESDIYLAEPGQQEQKLGPGKDVAIASNDAGIHALWINGTKLEWWSATGVKVLAKDAAFPSLISLPNQALLGAWEEAGGIALKLLR